VFSQRKTRRVVLKVAILLSAGAFVASAPAQVATQPRTSFAPHDLAKSVHNPFEDFVKVPLQLTATVGAKETSLASALRRSRLGIFRSLGDPFALRARLNNETSCSDCAKDG
jgi:hypothetical protein